MNNFMLSAMNVLSIFAEEKPVFIREHTSGYYSVGSYFSAKLLVEVTLYFIHCSNVHQ